MKPLILTLFLIPTCIYSQQDKIDSLELANSKLEHRMNDLLTMLEHQKSTILELEQELEISRADTSQIYRLKMEIETMKEIMRGWVIQLDEVITENKALRKENEELKEQQEQQ